MTIAIERSFQSLRAPSSALRCGDALPVDAYAEVRREMMLRHFKWDAQVEDTPTIATFPLLIDEPAWGQLCGDAMALFDETLEVEDAVLRRPDLFGTVAIPRRARSALLHAESSAGLPRVMRFDFHPTAEGWRVSEVNADVPGGYAESTELPRLFARHFPGTRTAGSPGARWADAIARGLSPGATVALLFAAGHLEDLQVVSYLAARLNERGLDARLAQPRTLRWTHSQPTIDGRPIERLLRFYQGEWLACLRRREERDRLLRCASVNPIRSMISESKRMPLVWDRLTLRVPTWRRLLPETRDPRDAPWRSSDGWLLKAAFCNCGDAVMARDIVPPREWRRAAWSATLRPGRWVAQWRFEVSALRSPAGWIRPCVGVFVIDGAVVGAYARYTTGPIVNYAAVDVPLLVRNPEQSTETGT